MREAHPDRGRIIDGLNFGRRRPAQAAQRHPHQGPGPRSIVHRELAAAPLGDVGRLHDLQLARLDRQVGEIAGIAGGRRGPG